MLPVMAVMRVCCLLLKMTLMSPSFTHKRIRNMCHIIDPLKRVMCVQLSMLGYAALDKSNMTDCRILYLPHYVLMEVGGFFFFIFLDLIAYVLSLFEKKIGLPLWLIVCG